jgi:hypothetical protein
MTRRPVSARVGAGSDGSAGCRLGVKSASAAWRAFDPFTIITPRGVRLLPVVEQQ